MADSDISWGAWIREHKLQSVGACARRLASTARLLKRPVGTTCAGTLWASSVAGSFAYNFSRPIPTSLKLIHSCVHRHAP